MILLIDNYDSFTYNLYQYASELGAEVIVVRNDKITTQEIHKMKPEKIIVSPGPCTPKEAGLSNEIILEFGPSMPVLGVCLGHQCIGAAFGSSIVKAREIMHGKTSEIFHDGKGIFKGIDNPFNAIRYHSLVIQKDDLPECLEITAWTKTGIIMGIRHKEYPIEGVQFHPESILTEAGKVILSNFLKVGDKSKQS